nr:unnamed protein product [Digitaria exilis]
MEELTRISRGRTVAEVGVPASSARQRREVRGASGICRVSLSRWRATKGWRGSSEPWVFRMAKISAMEGRRQRGALVMLRRVKPGRGFDDLAAGEVFDDTCEVNPRSEGTMRSGSGRTIGTGRVGVARMRELTCGERYTITRTRALAAPASPSTESPRLRWRRLRKGECGGQRGRWKTGEAGRRGFRCL